MMKPSTEINQTIGLRSAESRRQLARHLSIFGVEILGAEGIGEFGDFLKFSLHLLGNFFACWFSHIFTLVNLVVYVWQNKQHILSKAV